MRRFRLISRDDAYDPLICGEVYSGDVKPHGWEEDVLWNAKFNTEDWQEVFFTPNETPIHQTDLGYYAGLAMTAILSNEQLRNNILFDKNNGYYKDKCNSVNVIEFEAVQRAKRIIKQLKEECQDK